MSFEGIANSESRESLEQKALRVRNEIQISIMKRLCSPDEGKECFTRWVEENSRIFGTVFQRTLEDDPEMLDNWEKMREEYLDFFIDEINDAKSSSESRRVA